MLVLIANLNIALMISEFIIFENFGPVCGCGASEGSLVPSVLSSDGGTAVVSSQCETVSATIFLS